MAEDQERTKSMYEEISATTGAKVLGPSDDKKKAADRILASYEGRQATRKESIMDEFADSVNHEPKSIGERLEGF